MFDLLFPPYLESAVAKPALSYFKRKFGANGLKIEKPFSVNVPWTPTIQIQSSGTDLILIEVTESPYPLVFKSAYPSLLHEEGNRAIKVFQACPLEVFHDKKNSKEFRDLKTHGFGLVTVDENGVVDEQFSAAVVIHHIAETKFDSSVKDLPSDVKAAFVNAFAVYRTNARQGLNAGGQVVEALIHQIAAASFELGLLTSYSARAAAADVIDNLYGAGQQKLKDQRACFGGARQFMKLDRNASSHPAKSKKQATVTMQSTKEGFESAIRVASELSKARKSLGIKKRLSV